MIVKARMIRRTRRRFAKRRKAAAKSFHCLNVGTFSSARNEIVENIFSQSSEYPLTEQNSVQTCEIHLRRALRLQKPKLAPLTNANFRMRHVLCRGVRGVCGHENDRNEGITCSAQNCSPLGCGNAGRSFDPVETTRESGGLAQVILLVLAVGALHRGYNHDPRVSAVPRTRGYSRLSRHHWRAARHVPRDRADLRRRGITGGSFPLRFERSSAAATGSGAILSHLGAQRSASPLHL